MITIIEAKDRYLAEHGWLSSYHLFSFAEYYDTENMNFEALRVFNDDTIDGNNGFGKHGHRDMEIITIVLRGELTHEDTMGNRRKIQAGEVQYMSAGTGVMHSEMNTGDEQTHLYQIWLQPRVSGLIPKYEQKDFSTKEKNTLVPVASGVNLEEAILICANATMYLCTLEKEKSLLFPLSKGRKVFMYVTSGSLAINGSTFIEGDQARITDEDTIQILAEKETDFVMISLGGVDE